MLPDPQLDDHRAVVRELIPDGFVGLAVGDLAERGAVDLGEDSPVDDEVIDELGERMIPAADQHVLRQRGQVRVGGLAIVEVGPDPIAWLGEAAVEVAEHDERPRPLRRLVMWNPRFTRDHYSRSTTTGRSDAIAPCRECHDTGLGFISATVPGSRSRHYFRQLGKSLSMDAPALRKREELVTVRLETEKSSKLIKHVTETRGGGEGFEPACGPVALLHAPMILLEMIIQVAVGPVHHPISEDITNHAWVGVVAIRDDPVGCHPSHRPG